MIGLFSSCSLLISLDSYDYNSEIIDNCDFLDSCINLEYINFKKLDESKLIDYDFMFFGVPENFVICINITRQKIFSEIIKKSDYVIDCSNDWKSKQKKLINNSNECIDSYINSTHNEYNGISYVNSQNIFENNNTINNSKCELDKYLICSPEALNKSLCTKCNTNYYPKENDSLNIGEYINCYN